MTDQAQEEAGAFPIPHEDSTASKPWTIWLACSLLILGSLVAGLPLLFVLWLTPLLAAPYVLFATFAVPKNRRRAIDGAPNISLEAAQFRVVPQVMTLLTNLLLLALSFFPTFSFFLFLGSQLGWGWVKEDWALAVNDLAVTLIFFLALPLGTLALCFGIPYHFSKPLVAGEQWALTHRLHAYRLIRLQRWLNWFVMYFYLLGAIAWLVLAQVAG